MSPIGFSKVSAITAGVVGVAAAGTGIALSRDEQLADTSRKVAIGEVAGGAALLVGGLVTGRMVAANPRASLAGVILGQAAAALGAGLLVGGGIALGVPAMLGASTSHTAINSELDRSHELDERASSEGTAMQEHREGGAVLIDEAKPAPKRTGFEDGRIDLVGSSVDDAARAIVQRYDHNDNGNVSRFEQQHTVDGRTTSVGALVEAAANHTIPENVGGVRSMTTDDLRAYLHKHVDREHEGTPGVLDPEELEDWSSGPGEHVLKLDEAWLKGVEREAIVVGDHTWHVGTFDNVNRVLALPGIDSLEAAAGFAGRRHSAVGPGSYVVVEMPKGSGARYGLMSLIDNGTWSETAFPVKDAKVVEQVRESWPAVRFIASGGQETYVRATEDEGGSKVTKKTKAKDATK